ncbi:parathyroid hormone/parathyroid hormone-related peptide receptor-like [Crassostrea virginica]
MNLLWLLVVLYDFFLTCEGRGCYVDPKIYIVRIFTEQQTKLLIEARYNCTYNQLTKWTNQTNKGLMCGSTFDDLMCWPPTPAGTTAEQHCPSYINKFNVKGRATRVCNEDGSWYSNPEFNVTGWTNFTGCVDTSKDLVKNLSHLRVISGIVTTGYFLSLGTLSVAVAIMLFIRKLRCPRNIIHMNMFLSFMLRAVICFIKDLYPVPEGRPQTEENGTGTAKLFTVGTNWPCKTVYSLFHYAILANYAWIFIEGAYLHSLIFQTMTENSKSHRYFIGFGWTFPVICIIPWVIVRKALEDTLCWSTHSPENKFDWIIRGPIVVSVVINFFFFINLLRIIFSKVNDTTRRIPHRHRRMVRSTVILIPLFGVYYVISIAMPDCMDSTTETVWLYVESCVNSLQGFLVAILFCFTNAEVKKEVQRAVVSRLSKKLLKEGEKVNKGMK